MGIFRNELIKHRNKAIGQTKDDAIEMIGDDGHNCCIMKENGKLMHDIGSLGMSYVYLEVNNGIVIDAHLQIDYTEQ